MSSGRLCISRLLSSRMYGGTGGGTSDPFAVVTKLTPGEAPQVIGRTEVIHNTLSPNWTKGKVDLTNVWYWILGRCPFF